MSDFGQVIVIGYGVIAGKVLSYIDAISDRYGFSVAYIEHERYPFNGAKKYAENNNLEGFTMQDKEELTDFFAKKAELGKLLIVSAGNNYLFPCKIVENKNVTIMNFHSALLPDLPGRNATTWAIYKGYERTGITWHFVSVGIDTGDIIIQKECSIDTDTKAYELVAKQMNIASGAFEECFDTILDGSVRTSKQKWDPNRKVYRSTEIPQNGHFDMNDSTENIYRLLRSMDYGKNDIFPSPTSDLDGKRISIKRYRKIENVGKQDNNTVYLPFNNGEFLLLKYDIK